MRPRVLLISGSMGAGKTTVLGEASDVLLRHGLVHAAIDLDAIAFHALPDASADALHRIAIRTIFRNAIDQGVTHFLIAVAIENHTALLDLHSTFEGADFVVCRLAASVETMQARLRRREPGMRQQEFVDRSRQLQTVLDAAGVEDFVVSNDGRSITEVAEEMLSRANWLSRAAGRSQTG